MSGAPTWTWTAITDASLAADKPFTEAIAQAFRGNLHRVQEHLYDPSIHIPKAQHDHDGICSAGIVPPGSNLVERASLNATSQSGSRWTKHAGVTWENATTGGAAMSAAGHYVYTPLGGALSDPSTMFGSGGCVLNVSAFVKADGSNTTGQLAFGLTVTAPPTATGFLSGCRALLNFDALTTSYQRFHFAATIAAAPGGNVNFGAIVGTRFDVGIHVDYVQVTAGSRLAPWHPMPGEAKHFRYKAMSYGCPFWGWAESMTSAVPMVAS